MNPFVLFGPRTPITVVGHWNWFGLTVLAAWFCCAIIAWRLRHRLLVCADAVIAFALVLTLASQARIFGPLYWYLLESTWPLALGMFVTIAWTAAVVVQRLAISDRLNAGRSRVGAICSGTLLVVLAGHLTVSAMRQNVPYAIQSYQLAHVVPATVAAVKADRDRAKGPANTYVVTWNDPTYFGGIGFGMLNALDAAGIPAGLRPGLAGVVAARELIPPGYERGGIQISVGDAAIRAARLQPGAVQVASFDGRSTEQIDEAHQIRSQLRRFLAARHDNLALADNPMALASQLDVSPSIQRKLYRLNEIGSPVAVFLVPPATKMAFQHS